MSNTPLSRDLTSREQSVIDLLKVFEIACDEHKPAVTLEGSKDAAEAVYRMEIKLKACKALKVDFIPATERYKITFSLLEFNKYVNFMLKSVGLSLRIDGSLQTHDKLIISNDYLTEKKR